MAQNPFAGRWRIVWMSGWDQDYVDMDVPGHITFGAGSSGSFQFGLVQAQTDCKLDAQQSKRIQFTWHGFDEGDEMTGRGHAEIVGDELQSHLYIHLGDDSAFCAVRPATAARKPTRQRRPD
ncbi:hypothetical protein [Roseateles saccharophilus]|uniref:Lipocalin-like protein n=1 Tax=Roseateles saccharophilus TaxID=304 RepID=A0A4R3UQ06_ROSSA|nr:hypothetical protein [Roseateles saccharophilus]TCU92633.1 hypothetical protein EV671_10216 [Roseateles saccharophilus]